jgi:hypothetical protein
MVPLEAAGVIGAVGGIAEIAKQALGPQGSGAQGGGPRSGPWEKPS